MSAAKIAIALFVTFSANSAIAATKLTPLNGAELKSEYVGKTWHLAWSNGKKKNTGTQTLAPDGSATLAMDDGFKDTGTWSIQGNKLCQKWKSGSGTCAIIYRIDGGNYLWKGKGQWPDPLRWSGFSLNA